MILEFFLALILVYLCEKGAQFWDDWEKNRHKKSKFKYFDLKNHKPKKRT